MKLRCGDGVDWDAIALEDQAGDPVVYRVDLRWNRLTYTGTVTAAPTRPDVLGSMDGVTFEAEAHAVRFPCGLLHYETIPDPTPSAGRATCAIRVREETEQPASTRRCAGEGLRQRHRGRRDGDGENEAVVRTRGRRSRIPSTTAWTGRSWRPAGHRAEEGGRTGADLGAVRGEAADHGAVTAAGPGGVGSVGAEDRLLSTRNRFGCWSSAAGSCFWGAWTATPGRNTGFSDAGARRGREGSRRIPPPIFSF